MTTEITDTDGDVKMVSGAAPGNPVAIEQRDGCLVFNRAADVQASISTLKTGHLATRANLERSIIEVLAHDGFSAATPQAMDSFTSLVETYIESIIRDIKAVATSSRREHVIPSDFDTTLRRYNLPLSALTPHLRRPMDFRERKRTYEEIETVSIADSLGLPLPFLGHDISGRDDKVSKQYVPPTFPEFPAQHTYKFTPKADGRVWNTQKIREAAAENAQQGEEALRRLVRASKMRKQKEVQNLAEGDDQGKERFELWQSAMREAAGKNSMASTNGILETDTDRSMIVNGDHIFSRKDASRHSNRTGTTNVART